VIELDHRGNERQITVAQRRPTDIDELTVAEVDR